MYKALKDSKIIAINSSGKFPCLIYDEVVEDAEHTLEDFTLISGEYVLNEDSRAIDVKKALTREIRNNYLSESDKYMIEDFPITPEEKSLWIAYRQYLRDFTLEEGWWNLTVLTFEEWKENEQLGSNIPSGSVE